MRESHEARNVARARSSRERQQAATNPITTVALRDQTRRYSWMMFEHPADTAPVETVVVDVNLAQALEIDRRLAERFKSTLLLAVTEKFAPAD